MIPNPRAWEAAIHTASQLIDAGKPGSVMEAAQLAADLYAAWEHADDPAAALLRIQRLLEGH